MSNDLKLAVDKCIDLGKIYAEVSERTHKDEAFERERFLMAIEYVKLINYKVGEVLLDNYPMFYTPSYTFDVSNSNIYKLLDMICGTKLATN